MTFYQELQLNQAGSKNLLKKSETLKEKLYHMWVYLVKIAVTMAFCFLFVTIFSILFGNENSIVGVVVLLCLMVFRNADLGIHTGQSTMLLALFFVIMTVCPHLANQFSPVLGMLLNIAALAVLILFDIIGGSGRDLTKYDLLCRTSACKCSNLILKFFFRHQIFITLLNLHSVAECT